MYDQNWINAQLVNRESIEAYNQQQEQIRQMRQNALLQNLEMDTIDQQQTQLLQDLYRLDPALYAQAMQMKQKTQEIYFQAAAAELNRDRKVYQGEVVENESGNIDIDPIFG